MKEKLIKEALNRGFKLNTQICFGNKKRGYMELGNYDRFIYEEAEDMLALANNDVSASIIYMKGKWMDIMQVDDFMSWEKLKKANEIYNQSHNEI